MRTVATYIADDGKIFDSKEKCKKYEFSLKLKKIENIKIFDAEGNCIKLDADNFREVTKFYDFEKIVIPTKKDYEALMKILKERNINMYALPSEGIWYNLENIIIVGEEESFKLYSEKECIDIIDNLKELLKLGD